MSGYRKLIDLFDTATSAITPFTGWPIPEVGGIINLIIKGKNKKDLNKKIKSYLENKELSGCTYENLNNNRHNMSYVINSITGMKFDNTDIEMEKNLNLCKECRSSERQKKVFDSIREIIADLREFIWGDPDLRSKLSDEKLQEQILEHTMALEDEVKRLRDDFNDMIEQQCHIVVRFPSKCSHYHKRKETEDLVELVANNRNVFICGMGGIGKSELCFDFAERYSKIDDKHRVVWVNYKDNLKESIINCVQIDTIKDLEEKDKEELFRKKVSELNRFSDTLLLIDNYNKPDKENRDQLDECSCKKIYLTRMPSTLLDNEVCLEVGQFGPEDCFELFSDLLIAPFRSFSERKKEEIDKLFSNIGYHTLTIKLIAGLLNKYVSDYEQIFYNLLNIEWNTEIKKDGETSEGTVLNHIEKLFDMSKLDNHDREILRFSSMLGASGLKRKMFEDCFKTYVKSVRLVVPDFDIASRIEVLFETGWLDKRYDKDTYDESIVVHALVRQYLYKKLSPDNLNCRMEFDDFCLILNEMEESTTRVEVVDVVDTIKNISMVDNNNLQTYGEIAEYVGQYNFALKLFKQKLDFDSRCSLVEDNVISDDYENMGIEYGNLGEYEEELKCHMKALNIRKKAYPLDDIGLAISYNNVGSAYFDLGNNEEALRYHMDALDIRKNILQPDHPDFIQSYTNIGIIYGNLGDNKKALEYCIKALDVRKNNLPPDHPDLAAPYNNLGAMYNNLGDHDNALGYYMKALNIREKSLPLDHPDLASSYANIGVTYGDLGDNRKALDHYMKALNIFKKVLSPDHPKLATLYYNIGISYKSLGDNEGALEYYMKALNIREKVFSPDHISLAAPYNNMGAVYNNLGDNRKALECYMKALNIREKVLSQNHPDLVKSYNNIGDTYGNLGDNEKALEYKIKALNILKKIHSSDSLILALAYLGMCDIYGNLGDNEKALEYKINALNILEKVFIKSDGKG